LSIIKGVLQEELKRLNELAQEYNKKLNILPKGSISRKKRNKNVYLYRAYREKDKIKFIYIGLENSRPAKTALEDRNLRIKYQNLLKKVQSDIKEIKRALNEKK
jgi:hypothetical protein